ncbi:hypothetical protein, unlikely [Trypanosoma brucei gambiense DAL972]|uniref:Uncharacterized protein n=1 Tax=Trypanosoma brucei gambiense (strain MHOM/CI/86/DAL972) TaxID=679716 RepID=C9ZUY9_TRYB9|nr:hypothetical protein, unlikely [Trypanosoma brucei gambiense DAL972]CBH13227.1 hypothetical protein, unlikely [Trypanosoma brucei gambiense DAL972]|eukprot:XP_011775504.1 hypothetical protein, unlikely [Trypanosoma brucei gambiense DAL972]
MKEEMSPFLVSPRSVSLQPRRRQRRFTKCDDMRLGEKQINKFVPSPDARTSTYLSSPFSPPFRHNLFQFSPLHLPYSSFFIFPSFTFHPPFSLYTPSFSPLPSPFYFILLLPPP